MKRPHRLVCLNTGSPTSGAVQTVVKPLENGTGSGSHEQQALGFLQPGPTVC